MKQLAIVVLKAYRLVISPLYGQVCKFHPSCSAYTLEAVEVHGAARGSWLGITRIGRCHPWSLGGYDPVPGTAAAREWAAEQTAKSAASADDPDHSPASDGPMGGKSGPSTALATGTGVAPWMT